jgi:Kef-type K+ transport system membrane component KefB
MPHETALLATVAAGPSLAFVFGLGATPLRMPPLVRYLLAGVAIRKDDLAVKERYEAALRDARYVVTVLAPAVERRDRAAAILGTHGAHLMNYLGCFSMERIAP